MLFFIDKKEINFVQLKLKRDELIFIAMIFIFTASVLIPQLTTIPFTVHNDEGEMWINAQNYFIKAVNIFELNKWYGYVNLGFYPTYLSLKYFGNGLPGERFISVINAFLTIIPFYYMGKFLFNKQIAAISSIIFFSSHIFIAFFRTGFHFNQSIVIITCTFCCLVLAFRLNSRMFLYLSGIFCALGFYTYMSARIIIFIMLFYFLYLLIKRTTDRKVIITSFIIIITGFIITFTPLIFSFAKSPDLVNKRANNINIFYGIGNIYMKDILRTSSDAEVLLHNIIWSVAGLNAFRDNGEQYNTDVPFLEFYTSILFLLSFPYLLARFRNEKTILLVISFLMIFIAAWVITIKTPSFQKLLIVMPIISLMAALPLYNIASYISDKVFNEESREKWFKIIVSFFLLLIVISNYEGYFAEYILKINNQLYYDEITLASKVMNELKSNYKIYVVNIKDSPYRLDYSNKGFPFMTGRYGIGVIEMPDEELTLKVDNKSNKCFFLQSYLLDKVYKIVKKSYPKGKLVIIKNTFDNIILAVYFVDKQK